MQLTDEQRLKISIATKGKKHPNYHRTPEGNRKIIESPNSGCFKKGIIPWNKDRVMPIEERKRISETEKEIGHAPTDEARKLAAEKIKSTERSLEHRLRLSKSLKGRKPAEITIVNLKKYLTGRKQSEDMIAKKSAIMKVVWSNPEYKKALSEKHKETFNRPEMKERLSRRSKLMWDNRTSEEKGEILKKTLANSSRKPNNKEKKLGRIIDSVCPNEYKFTGNGEISIGNKIPDFTNINGQKKVIELFGDYFHDPNRVKMNWHRTYEGTKEVYKQYGFDCLIIWEHELKNSELVLDKVREFNANGIKKS